MSDVRFFNRRTGLVESEQIYGEHALRSIYQSAPGRLALHLLVKRALFSAWYGRKMDAPSSRSRIMPFIQQYRLDPEEFETPPDEFDSFNDFFSRRLKEEARPIDPDPTSLVFPADGRHLLIPECKADRDIWVKGIPFNLPALIGDRDLAQSFLGGSVLISRLCPVDYHRFHFPCGGVPGRLHEIDGPLFSVNPIALMRRPSILWENKRCWTPFESGRFGTILQVEVGATCVGTIIQTAVPEKPVLKGEEKGYFRFGGSCVITLFEAGRVRWADDLLQHGPQWMEVYAPMGDVAGWACGGAEIGDRR